MNYWLKTSISIFILLCGQNQAGLAVEETYDAVQMAALVNEDGTVPCGQDGICNVGGCRNDPDCPSLPNDTSGGQTQSWNKYASRPSDIKDCTSKETTEIASAVDWGAEHWEEYNAVLDDIRDWPVTIGNCLEDRFQKNGKVVCEKNMKGNCTTKDGSANGWAVFLNKKCHMCPDFLTKIKQLPDPSTNRQACYFALVTHEWGHTCERGHKTLEIIDDEAFNFWKTKHPEVNINFSSCGMS